MNPCIPVLATTMLLVTAPALAHTGAGSTHGFTAGLLHPLFGLDHVLAMVAVGLWAGLIGGRAVWAWPAAFVSAMILGAMLGIAGAPLPWVETAIAASVLVLGLAVAWRISLPVLAGVALCGAFAVFHGYAHGAELPHEAEAATYVAGFSLATALLHGIGISIGLGFGPTGRSSVWLPRLTGGAVALAGVAFLIG